MARICLKFVNKGKIDEQLFHLEHPSGRTLTSDWSVNSFITVVGKIFFESSVTFLSKARLKKFSQATIIKLFTDQSELNALKKLGVVVYQLLKEEINSIQVSTTF